MNNEEAIRRKKLYYEGLERAIAQPIPEASAKEIEATINVQRKAFTFASCKARKKI